MLLILLHLGKDVILVDEGSSEGGRVEEPYEEGKLEEEVEGNELKDEAGEVVDDIGNTKHNPVCEPLSIITCSVRFKCKEGHEAGIGNAKDASDVGVSDTKHHENNASVKCIF